MKAWQYDNAEKPSRLHLVELPAPVPGPQEILVRVHAASVTPSEIQWYPSTHNMDGSVRVTAVPGHEFSGTIEACGADVGASHGGSVGFQLGQAVYGMSDWYADGATAEYCLTDSNSIVPKPPTLTHAQAASVPISALTAWQGLFDRAKLREGESVLIHGGAGAVGVYAIQLALRHGARVVTTASARSRKFLLELGVEQVIDYHSVRFDEVLENIDVVFDGVGGDTLQRSWSVVSPQGRVVSIAADSEHTTDERIKAAFFIVEPNQSQLQLIGDLLDAQEIKPFVDAVVPFAEADKAYAQTYQARQGCGKMVVTVTA